MSRMHNDGFSVGEEALIKALGNTTIHCFTYDVRNNTIHIPQRTCERFECKSVYENMPYSFADDFVYEDDTEGYIKMYTDIGGGADTAEALFRNKDGSSWCNVTLTVTERGSSGEPLNAVGIIKDLSKTKSKEVRYVKWLNALGEMYHALCYADLVERTYVFVGDNVEPPFTSMPERGSSRELIEFYKNNYVHPDDRTEYSAKLTLEYIRSRLNARDKSFSIEYRQVCGGCCRWVRGVVILADLTDSGEPYHVLYTIQYIDEEKAEKDLLESSLSLMRDTFYRIGCIDLEHNSMRTISISKHERNEAPLFKSDFNTAIRNFARDYVLDEYRDKFLNIMLPERMKNIFDIGTDYMNLTYRRYENGVPKWVRTELIPMNDYSEGNRRVMWYVKNISDEKALEERMNQKLLQMNADVNLRLETILDGISGGFKISCDDGKYTYRHVNESTAKLFGYTTEEFIKVTNNCASDLVYPPDRDKTREKLRKDMQNSNTYSVKYRVKCKDGSLKWIVDSGKKVVNENGESLFYSLYHDVTELEERNIELKNALMMRNQMVGSLSCGIFSYRLPRREIIALNSEAKRLFDIDENAVSFNISNIIREKIFPEDAAAMQRAVHTIKKPGDSAAYEFRITHRDGKVYRVQANSSLLQFEDGSQFILSSMLDITKQTELTEIIREERSQYRDTLLTNCEYAYSFDLTGGYITEEFVTKHGINIFQRLGLKVPMLFDDFIEKWIENFKPEFLTEDMRKEVSREAMLKRYAQGERTGEVEYYSSITNTYTRITSLLSRSERNGHMMAVIVGTDTTKNRQNEAQAKQALMQAYEAARRANSAKSDFLSRMSHDIRTPMNAIIGMTAIAGTHLDDQERVADCLHKITVSSEHLLSLINEVLDMSKIESGKVDLNEEDFNLSDLIDNLISMVRPQIKARNQNLKVNINEVTHEKVIGDKLRIQQSFLNFMSNAIKYTPDGGDITLCITEKNRVSEKVGRFEFVFEDTGIGMSPEFVSRIFEPFTRASDSRVSKEQGTGLGLAIADNLVRMMDGNIEVESTPGKGSRFTVTISLKLQSEEELSYDDMAGLPVLVADNDMSACENVCRILDEMGMDSEWVTDGKSAVERIVKRHGKEKDYFSAIIDWKMPGMDGIQATKEIRRLVGSEMPIIIISAYDWSDIELEARAAGADAFISKPLFKSKLAHLFHDMIHGENQRVAESGADCLAEEDFSGRRVLLVDDNELNTEIAKELLEMTGLEVECAENGQVAVDKFAASESGYYQMIFMDIQMPVMNGNEATRAIRSLPRRDAKRVPIVAMTANAFFEDIQMSLNSGMNEHIPKPLDLKHLVKTLKRWLY